MWSRWISHERDRVAFFGLRAEIELYALIVFYLVAIPVGIYIGLS